MAKDCLCMGSILTFLTAPSPTLGDGADDRLAARVDVDVLDPHQLLPLATVTVESVGERRERAHQPVGVLQAQLAAGKGLLAQCGPAEALQGCLVGRHHLHGQDPLDDVTRADAFDHAETEIALHTFQRGRRGSLEKGSLELQPMGSWRARSSFAHSCGPAAPWVCLLL